MFKILISLIVIHVTLSLGFNFEKEFIRLISKNSNPKKWLYGASYSSRSNEGITLPFTQKLDHFQSTDKATWEQRTIILNTYYEKHGPFFIYLFGNEEASMDWLRKSQIMSYAKDSKALVIGLEHRFYGESRPFEDTSLEYLGYLNIQQALADVAYFIGNVNEISMVPENTKWITFGGFYGGSLAAWARMRYPHLVHGAVASSALISVKSDFPEYLESVKNTYLSFDKICARNIGLAFQQLDDALKTEEGRAKISEQFKLCTSLGDNENDIALLQNILRDVISLPVEKNKDVQFSMQTVCDIMNRDSDMAKDNMGDVNDLYLSLNNVKCWYNRQNTIISVYQIKDYERRQQSTRLWLFQACSQLGLDLTTTKSVEMFGEYKPELIGQAKYCPSVFGPKFTQQTIDDGVKQTNIEFGALAFNASNVIFVVNSLDPWKNAGIIEKSENAQYDLIYIDGTSHQADLEPDENNDDLKNGIRQIEDLLKSWLA